MATAPIKNKTSSIDKDWASQTPREQLRSIAQLDASHAASQKKLIGIACGDEDEQVRCGAIKRLNNLDTLKELQHEPGSIREAASQQIYRILAAVFDAGIAEERRLSSIRELPATAAKQIALITKCKITADEAIRKLEKDEDLAELSLTASSVHVRKNAVSKIEDLKLLANILEQVRGKDKTVFKVIEQRLNSPKEPSKLDVSSAIPEGKPTKHSAEDKVKSSTTTAAEIETSVGAIPEKNIPELEDEFSRLSHKSTARLIELQNKLKVMHGQVKSLKTDIVERISSLDESVARKVDKNKEYQQQLKQNTEMLLDKLKQALEEGLTEKAMPTWDKIQGNISNTSGQIKTQLKHLAAPHKARLDELRDWKNFAATEKKKQLVDQMQRLAESQMHAAEKSKHISKMHKEWKSLGRSSQNESLWKKFKKISDQAYEACKEHFKQRKQLMASNLKQRRELCEKLESELALIVEVTNTEAKDETKDTQPPTSTQLNKLLHSFEQDWKKYAPVEQSKIKSLQKRFYNTVNKLRKIRKSTSHQHAVQKQRCIAEAQTLTRLEDNSKAMNEAKRLQQEWKKIGPTSYKEDNKYWLEFRAACDKIFEKRDKESKLFQEELKRAEEELGKILKSLEALLKLDDDGFRNSRSDFQDMLQKFSTMLSPKLKQRRKQLLDQFNALKRKIDLRFKILPDKKLQLLKKAVLGKANFLQKFENELLNSSDEPQFLELKKRFDQPAWDKLEPGSNADFEEALGNRLARIFDASSQSSLHSLAQESDIKLRTLCVRAEIRANIETPKSDQSLRMKIQLEQLSKGFGQSKPDSKADAKYAAETELQAYCLGPLENKSQQELSQRLQTALRRLL